MVQAHPPAVVLCWRTVAAAWFSCWRIRSLFHQSCTHTHTYIFRPFGGYLKCLAVYRRSLSAHPLMTTQKSAIWILFGNFCTVASPPLRRRLRGGAWACPQTSSSEFGRHNQLGHGCQCLVTAAVPVWWAGDFRAPAVFSLPGQQIVALSPRCSTSPDIQCADWSVAPGAGGLSGHRCLRPSTPSCPSVPSPLTPMLCDNPRPPNHMAWPLALSFLHADP